MESFHQKGKDVYSYISLTHCVASGPAFSFSVPQCHPWGDSGASMCLAT